MPAQKRGQSKAAQSASRNTDTTTNNSRSNPKDPRRVHFDDSKQSPNSGSRQASRNGQQPSAIRGRARGGGRSSARSLSKQQPNGTKSSGFGNQNNASEGASKAFKAATSQIANHITPQPQSEKRNWSGVSDAARFDALKRHRDTERAEGIKNGTVPDPNRPMRLADAITLVGTCQDMCPEFERVKRIVEKDIWREEGDPAVEDSGTRSSRKPAENRMVKRFARSAAGQEEQLPSDLRPPPVLQTTLDYLLEIVAGRATNLHEVHHFVWDRTRAIRNDFSIQQVSRKSDVVLAVNCYETIARFHIASLHQLAGLDRPYDEYDPQQEREQLDKTILSLVQYYEDYKEYQPENEAEFRAYQIIFQIQRPSPDIEDRIQCWDDTIIQDPRVQHALAIYRVACNYFQEQGPLQPSKPHRVAQSNWMSFWKIISSPETSYLMGCIAEMFFPLMRRTILKSLWKAFRPKTNKPSTEWTLEELQDVLGMATPKEVADYVMRYGFQLVQDDDGSQRVDLGSVFGNLPDLHIAQECTDMVERKRRGLKIPAVAKNMERLEAMERGLVEDEEAQEDGSEQSAEEQDSLFVSQIGGPSQLPSNPFATSSKNGFASQHPFSSSFGTLSQSQTTHQPSALFGSPSTTEAPVQMQRQVQPSMFPSTRPTADGSFSMQFQSQQGEKPKATPVAQSSSSLSASTDRSTANQSMEPQSRQEIAARHTAEQELQRRRAQAAEQERQAAEIRALEEEQRKRTAALEAERLAKERAAREMVERRKQVAERAEQERMNAEKERQQAMAAQQAERLATEQARSQVLEDIARRMLLEPGGFLDQFVEYKAGPLIRHVQEQVESSVLQSEASTFRVGKLQTRYGLKWREVCRVKKLARIGRERRARRRQGQEERETRTRGGSLASDLDGFRRSQHTLRQSAASSPTSNHLSPPQPSARKSVRFSRADRPPTSSRVSSSTSTSNVAPRTSHPSHQQQPGDVSDTMTLPATTASPRAQSAKSMSTSTDSNKISNGARLESQDSSLATPNKSSDAVPYGGLSYTDWMAQRRTARATPAFRDSTNSAYFRMKAMGLNPYSDSLSPYAVSKTQSPPRLKRPRPSDSLNSSLIEISHHTAVPASSERDGSSTTRAIMPPPPPRKAAKLSASLREPNNTSLGSSTGSAKPSQQTEADDDDEFMAKVREIQDIFREGEDWYRNEVQEEKRRSAQSSRRSSLAGSPPQLDSQHWARHPAEGAIRRVSPLHHTSKWEPYARPASKTSISDVQQYDSTPPPMAPLRYRSRTSKFLPRDQFADARAARGEPMYIGSTRASRERSTDAQQTDKANPSSTTRLATQSPNNQPIASTEQAHMSSSPGLDHQCHAIDPNGVMDADAAIDHVNMVSQPVDIPNDTSQTANHVEEHVHLPKPTMQSSSPPQDATKPPQEDSIPSLNFDPTNGTSTFGSPGNFFGFGTSASMIPAPRTDFSSAFTNPTKASPFASSSRKPSNSDTAASHKSHPSSQASSRPPSAKSQTQDKPLTNGQQAHSSNSKPQSAHTASSSTESVGPFAAFSAQQNPFASQYAQHNPFSTSTTSLAPTSAKKNPFVAPDGSKFDKKPNGVPPEKQNPLQSSAKSSIGSQSSNPFAALADMDGEGVSGGSSEEESASQVDEEQEEEEGGDGDVDDGSEASYDEDEELHDESDGLGGFEDDDDNSEGQSPGRLVNGKSGASVEDAIEL